MVSLVISLTLFGEGKSDEFRRFSPEAIGFRASEQQVKNETNVFSTYSWGQDPSYLHRSRQLIFVLSQRFHEAAGDSMFKKRTV